MVFLMRNGLFLLVMAAIVLVSSAAAAADDKLKSSIDIQDSVDKAAADSQAKIDTIADDTEKMLAEFKLTMRQTDTLRNYNDHVQKIVNSQQEEIDSINDQLAEIDDTNQGVIPLMERMLDTLDQFIALDIPFLMEERTKRLEELRELMERADITVSEKYRRILEAYQVETEYGRTIEAYRAVLDNDPKNRTVEFLRVGRLMLLYQTLDYKETGIWDQDARSWKPLSEEYRKSVLQGLRIARKQAAPDLIKLPVRAPERVQ